MALVASRLKPAWRQPRSSNAGLRTSAASPVEREENCVVFPIDCGTVSGKKCFAEV